MRGALFRVFVVLLSFAVGMILGPAAAHAREDGGDRLREARTLLDEARRLDKAAEVEESTLAFVEKMASKDRAWAASERARAVTLAPQERPRVLAAADARDAEATLALQTASVYRARAAAIRVRARELRDRSIAVGGGRSPAPLPRVTLPRKPPGHPDPWALSALPEVTAAGAASHVVASPSFE